MQGKRLLASVLASLFISVAHATAQKNEASGLVGRTLIGDRVIIGSNFSDNKLRFGNGFTFEANYARYLLGNEVASIAVEVPFVVSPDEDWHTHASPVGDYRSFFLTPAARVTFFPGVAVSPWISAGGGFGHFSGNYSNTGSNPADFGNNVGAFQAGAGLDVRFAGDLSLRGAVRDIWSGKPALGVDTSNTHQRSLFVAVGIVAHF